MALGMHITACSRKTYCGATLVEILVVIAIVSAILSLSLPAIQSVRESGRAVSCQNNLRQIGLGYVQHHDNQGSFPSGGWGWGWAGEARYGSGPGQPGGWAFSLLPYVEQGALHDLSSASSRPSKSAVAELLETPVQLFYCPSRRGIGKYPYKNPAISQQVNSSEVRFVAKSDYAANSGDGYFTMNPMLPAGPATDEQNVIAGYAWPFVPNTGVVSLRSRIRISDIFDGTSHTLACGEKFLWTEDWTSGTDIGDDQSCYIGFDYDVNRWTDTTPLSDRVSSTSFADSHRFGSPHQEATHFAMCDGSVRPLAFSVDKSVFRKHGNRLDGAP